jgi:hypothetical protein
MLRLFGLLALAIYSNVAYAALIHLELDGEVLRSPGTRWQAPGPVPDTVHGVIDVDTAAFSSRDLDFEMHDPPVGMRLDSYRFVDVPVVSISITIDGSQLWRDAPGLKITFAGDNPSNQGLGGYFAYLAGNDSASQSLLLNYDMFPGLTAEQAQLDNDVLANLLLNPGRSVTGTYELSGSWGDIAGTLDLHVGVIPQSPPFCAWIAGLFALIVHRGLSMRRSSSLWDATWLARTPPGPR